MQHNSGGGDQPGTGEAHGSGDGMPPNLSTYSDTPQYDLATIVAQVGMRAMTLWNWERELHLPSATGAGEGVGVTAHLYSERDLVAFSWLRDQLLLGHSVPEAAKLLMQGQPGADGPTGDAVARGEFGATLARPPVNSRPLGEAATAWGRMPARSGADLRVEDVSGAAPQRARVSGGLRSQPVARPLDTAASSNPPSNTHNSGLLGGADGSLSTYNSTVPMRRSPATMPLAGSGYLVPVPPTAYQSAASQTPPTATTRPDLTWLQQAMAVPGPQAAPNVGSSYRSRPSGSLGYRDGRMGGASGSWSNPGASTPAAPASLGRELRNLVPLLLRAFVTFDTYQATMLVEEALSARPFEVVCTGLFIPALNRVSEMWGRNELTIPEERFATNFVRARLFSVFDRTDEVLDAPLAIVACGPHEMSDLNALMLATFWRRAHVRVVFLGQDVDGQALVHDVRVRRPRLVCVAITTPQRVRALARIAKGISQLGAPTPIFAYSGSPFARNPELSAKVSGVYLGDDPSTATWHATRLLGMAPTRGQPPESVRVGMNPAV